MRGLLSFSILWLLTKRDMYGQEIADELAQRRGTRPNPGTLYPALAELEKNRNVDTRKEGRKKIYTLTRTGSGERQGRLRILLQGLWGDLPGARPQGQRWNPLVATGGPVYNRDR
jgi:DNA-binding PadR family transcriptional regulator